MYNKEVEDYIKKYVDNLYNFYFQISRLELLSKTESTKSLYEPKTLGRRFILTNFMIERQTHYVLNNLVQQLDISETQYIIDSLRKLENTHNFESDVKPDKELIDNAILSLEYSYPNFMLVPISFFVDMHDWGMRLTKPLGGTLSYEKGQVYYNYLGKRCLIIWSNKFLNLSEIIIGNSMNTLWRYLPDKYNGKRVTIRITPEGADGVLLVKTDFEYHLPLPDEVSIIHFPEHLTKINEESKE